MVAHCLAGLPDEACGLLGGDPSNRRGRHLLPDPQRGRLGQALHGRPPGPPPGRPRRRGHRELDHRGLPLPHPHRGLPVADRRGPGPGPARGTTCWSRSGTSSPSCGATGSSTGSSPRNRSRLAVPVESQPNWSTIGGPPGGPEPDRAGGASEPIDRQGEPVPVQVNLPTVLRSHAGGAKTVSVEGSTVGEVLRRSEQRVPRAVRPGHRRRRVAPQVRQRLSQRRRRPLPVGARHPGDGRRTSSRSCRRWREGAVGRRSSQRPMTAYGSVLDLIGNTPLVDISHAEPQPGRPDPHQARGAEPGRLGQGPHRAVDDRGGGEGRTPRARARH